MSAQRLAPLLILLVALTACESREPSRLELPVRASTAALAPTLNTEGWTVTLSRARLVLADLEFTQLGEGHVRRPRWQSWILPTAHAHPGHDAGGTVTGTLSGVHLVELPGSGQMLGAATILEGRYRGFNFTFRAADAELVTGDEPLTGLSALLVGSATRGGDSVPFEARIELLASTRMVGGVFETTLAPEQRGHLTLELLTHDPVDDVSLFEGLDFATLTPDADGVSRILPGSPLHNILRRSVQDHAFHRITWSPEQ